MNIYESKPDFEVVGGELYKNVFNKRENMYEPPQLVTTTVPMISSILDNVTTGLEEVQLNFTDRHEKDKDIIIPRSELLIKHNITKALGSKGLDISEDNALDIIKYLRFIENRDAESIGMKTLTNISGYYDDKIYIGRKGEIVTKDGIDTESSIVYKNKNMEKNAPSIENINEDEWKLMIKNTLPNILKLNETKVSLAIVSWFLASVCKKPMQTLNKKKAYPILNIWGVRGTGKTTIAELMQKLLGGTDEIKSAKTTNFTIMTNMALSNAYPFILDEYKIGDIGEAKNSAILNMLKVAYNSNVEQRGNKDRTMEDYSLTSPICIIGENSFTGDASDAVKDRSAILGLSRSWLNKNSKKTAKLVKNLNSMELNRFLGGYLVFILKMLESGRLAELYNVAEDKINNFAEGYNTLLSDRHTLTLKVLSFGVEILRELYTVAEIDFNITEDNTEEMFKHALNHALNIDDIETSLDRTMQYFSVALINEFGEKDILCDVGAKRLYVRKTKLLNLIETHRYQGKADLPEKSAVKQYMKESYESGGYIVDMEEVKKIESKPVRCVVIDIKKLEELAKIDKYMWIRYSSQKHELNGRITELFPKAK